MHSTIFQISKTKMEQDDHISCYDFPEYFCGKFGIDWVGDELDDEDGFISLESCTPSELFTINRENRSITVNRDNIKLILRRMSNTIRDYANALNEDNITNWLETYNLKRSIENYLDSMIQKPGDVRKTLHSAVAN